jgi:hypothetical protein
MHATNNGKILENRVLGRAARDRLYLSTISLFSARSKYLLLSRDQNMPGTLGHQFNYKTRPDY